MDRKPLNRRARVFSARPQVGAVGGDRFVGRPHPFLELRDSSTFRFPASFLLPSRGARDETRQTARLAEQFVNENRGILNNMDVTVEPHYDGSRLLLAFRTGATIGAIPLLSPTTGAADYGLVIRPRFDWPGIGAILGATGWRIVPSLLKVPLLPRSERKIPPWVLSTIVVSRIATLLERLERRFELISDQRSAPRGSVDWGEYSRHQITRAQFLTVPCRFPDLTDDSSLRAAIRFTIQKQIGSLEGQRSAGAFILALMEMCRSLLGRVADVPPKQPDPHLMRSWLTGSLKTTVFREGLQAIEWTVDDRGLAGLSDLQGLAWAMSMEAFFEAWTETVTGALARKVGGVLRAGRKRQTVVPIVWQPAYLGSQKYLMPDLILQKGESTVIIDAKYKEHWEEMQERRWSNLDEELRQRHRADLLQVLAYANLATTPAVMVCLIYPCTEQTWNSLRRRGRLFHRASIASGGRRVEVLLGALPLCATLLPDLVTEFHAALESLAPLV